MSVHLFGVRHHGPGSARSLVRALKELEPDALLIEGPPDAEEQLSYALHADIEPPVALLVYVPEEPSRAVFYPFASFSPEWQAIRYGLGRKIPVRFMDLPQAHRLTPKPEAKDEAGPEPEAQSPPSSPDEDKPTDQRSIRQDPLRWVAQAAGYSDGERWWENMVEHRQNSAEVFAAVHELMTALRAEAGPELEAEERQREAYMRQTLRAAQKEGFSKIAVVCGAWHTPALATMPSAKEDSETLKGLPKVKVAATWIPWTYGRLTFRSGYGAGVSSPGWYEHLWEVQKATIPNWMTKAAQHFRAASLDISPAHAIEATRLAETLAALRSSPLPGLAEVSEAIQTVYCFGNSLPMRLVEEKLIVGEKLGRVPEETPKLPLVQDVAREQKRLRLPPKASVEPLDLDLRKPNDLDRSCLLHRLNILGISWGKTQHVRGKSGTFHELWQTKWEPEFAVRLIEASIWGNTVPEAASARMRDRAKQSQHLPELTSALESCLRAQLPEAIAFLLHRVEEVAAQTSDVPHLMEALPPLVQVQRYGDVRQTDVSSVRHVIDGLIARTCIGLPGACSALNDDAAEEMFGHLGAVDQAIRLLDHTEHRQAWQQVLSQLSASDTLHGLVAGRATRLLFDAKAISPEDLRKRLGLALAPALPATQAGAWAEGLLRGSGLLLLHHPELLDLIDGWVAGLNSETFTNLLPLLRRNFATFQPPERRQMGERLVDGNRPSGSTPNLTSADEINLERARLVVPVLQQIFGLEVKGEKP
jgi:hypothetical protein